MNKANQYVSLAAMKMLFRNKSSLKSANSSSRRSENGGMFSTVHWKQNPHRIAFNKGEDKL